MTAKPLPIGQPVALTALKAGALVTAVSGPLVQGKAEATSEKAERDEA